MQELSSSVDPGFRKLHPGYLVALYVIIGGPRAIAMQQTESNIRAFLIAEAFRFIERVVSMPGIKRIALVGSLTKEKAEPKDADILVTVDDDADLTALATAGRRLKGADIFLANPQDLYIGRICHCRRCEPGIRMACKARHCGKRHYLHDDFHVITLDPLLVFGISNLSANMRSNSSIEQTVAGEQVGIRGRNRSKYLRFRCVSSGLLAL